MPVSVSRNERPLAVTTSDSARTVPARNVRSAARVAMCNESRRPESVAERVKAPRTVSSQTRRVIALESAGRCLAMSGRMASRSASSVSALRAMRSVSLTPRLRPMPPDAVSFTTLALTMSVSTRASPLTKCTRSEPAERRAAPIVVESRSAAIVPFMRESESPLRSKRACASAVIAAPCSASCTATSCSDTVPLITWPGA